MIGLPQAGNSAEFTFIKGAHSQVNFGNRKKAFKNDEKCFLFHLQSSFRSQDI